MPGERVLVNFFYASIWSIDQVHRDFV